MHKSYQLPLPELGDGVQSIRVMHVAGLLPSVKAADKSRSLSLATFDKWLSTSDVDHISPHCPHWKFL